MSKNIVNKIFVSLAITAILGFSVLGIWAARSEAFLSNSYIEAELNIEKGQTMDAVYEKIFKDVDTPFGFKNYLKHIKNFGKNIKYGYYASSGLSLKEFLNNIASGVQSSVKVTVPEGFNIFDIASVLEKTGVTDKESFLKAAFDPDIIKNITGSNYESMEGFLFPGTYRFPKKIENAKIINAMYSQFRKSIPPDFKEKAAAQGLTEYQALILASIVQKETYSPTEAPVVASVFYNRLKLNMRLQADPTIIYGKYLDFDGNIYKRDIEDPSNIFNTYRHGGLPPTPICNPSLIALEAAANPAETDYLYFVANKRGSHLFSSDYRQHVNNVRKYQK